LRAKARRNEILNRARQTYGWKTEAPMKGLMISAFAAVALLAVVATTRLRPSSVDISLGSAAMPSLLELHTTAGVDKLPFQEVEDQSLIFPTVGKRDK
jgi:hypothetical protein